MAEVPYQPVPTAAPTSPGERIGIDTPGAAFGENIGQAFSRLGGTLEQAGGEVFQRALAIKQIANENEARDADAEYGKEQALRHAQFLMDPGPDPRAGLQKFLQDSDDLRKKYRAGLSNDESRRMYDASSLGFMLRNINSAATHAGEAFKRNVNGSIKASMELDAIKRVNPGDPDETADIETGFKRKVKGMIDTTPEEQDLVAAQMTQKLHMTALQSLGETNPLKALDLLELNKNKVGEDYPTLQRYLWQQNERITGDLLANEVRNKNPGATPDELEEKIRAAAPALAKGDKEFANTVVAKLRSIDGGVKRDATFSKWQANQDLTQLIHDTTETNSRALAAQPGVSDLIRRAGITESALQKSLDAKFSDIGAQNFRNLSEGFAHLNGLRYENRQELLDADLWDKDRWHLSNTQVLQLNRLRNEALKGEPLNSPQVKQIQKAAIDQYRPDLEAMGVLQKGAPGKNVAGKNWNAFVGNIGIAVENWEERNQKRLTDPEVIKKEIIPGLVAHHYGGFWTGEQPDFPTPSRSELNAATKKAQSEARAAGLPPPTLSEVNRQMSRNYWQDIIRKQEGAKGAPR